MGALVYRRDVQFANVDRYAVDRMLPRGRSNGQQRGILLELLVILRVFDWDRNHHRNCRCSCGPRLLCRRSYFWRLQLFLQAKQPQRAAAFQVGHSVATSVAANASACHDPRNETSISEACAPIRTANAICVSSSANGGGVRYERDSKASAGANGANDTDGVTSPSCTACQDPAPI